MESKTRYISRRKNNDAKQICAKDERNASLKKITSILQKPDDNRTSEDIQFLLSYSDIVDEVQQRIRRRIMVKQRLEEIEDPIDELTAKCKALARSIANSQHLVVYTGAGISTAARIPDYRGTNGIWTRLQQGKEIGNHDLSLAEPTYTHMALSTLYHKGILKYVVSQNCDGLHLRSGLPRKALSELHGNMSIEVCKHCKPNREYWRLFDVTENTARYSHKTMRRCYSCNNALVDTIVHFGERGTLQWPLNWSGACKNADAADTILCLGSSLKVLKKYPWLWQMDKPAKKRPNLLIVNLQWTPKDDAALIKINGKCDTVMKIIMNELQIQVANYNREKDPIFKHATLTSEAEQHTNSQPELRSLAEIKNETDIQNDIKEEVKDEEITANSEAIIQGTSTVDCDNDNEKSNININNDRNIFEIPKSENVPPRENPIQYPLICSTMNSFNTTAEEAIIANQIQFNYNAHLQALLSCYALSNPLFQSQVSLLAPALYPYQTSFLYSGLHSIINPVPFFTYENIQDRSFAVKNEENTQDNKVLVKQEITELKVSPEPEVPNCDFCFKNYKSYGCLFYVRNEPVFKKTVYRFSKSSNERKPVYCECCDYTSSSDSEKDDEDGEKKETKKAKGNDESNVGDDTNETDAFTIPVQDNESKEDVTTVTRTVQPGWFGKGYRKNRRNRKR